MDQALYGEEGFYLRERPSGHFRTSVSASPVFAEAVSRILGDVDARLGRPGVLDLVDIGAGEGALVAAVLTLVPPETRGRLRTTAVDLAPRPPGLPQEVSWAASPPESITGLVIANEWLDNVPLDIAEQTTHGPRLVRVDPRTGREQLGPPPEEPDMEWLRRWWPLPHAGQRAEIGRARDDAWASVIGRIARGRAVAVDYSHSRDSRPPCGTLTGYRDGAVVPPIPDGSCDITAHVALDACAAAGELAARARTARGASPLRARAAHETAGARGVERERAARATMERQTGAPGPREAGAPRTRTVLTTQREALGALGFSGRRPPLELAHADPHLYLRALTRASQEAELIEPGGLGGFGWLCQDIE